jgi:hypothetical protein
MAADVTVAKVRRSPLAAASLFSTTRCKNSPRGVEALEGVYSGSIGLGLRTISYQDFGEHLFLRLFGKSLEESGSRVFGSAE